MYKKPLATSIFEHFLYNRLTLCGTGNAYRVIFTCAHAGVSATCQICAPLIF